MSVILGVVLFVGGIGVLDARLPWPGGAHAPTKP